MRQTRNSRTSSTGKDSKQAMQNIHWDGIRVRNQTVFGAAAVNTVANSTALIFPRSKILTAVPNPNTDEGVVHLIRQIIITAMLVGTVAGEAGSRNLIQIHRRDPGAGELSPVSIAEGNMVEQIAYEEFIPIQVFQQSTGTAASQVFRDTHFRQVNNLPEPLVMVKPYYLKMRSLMSSAVAQTTTMDCWMYIQVESIRVKGNQYRRLLDHYTQMPTLIER